MACQAHWSSWLTSLMSLILKDTPSVLKVPFVGPRVADAYGHHDRRGQRDHTAKRENFDARFIATVSFGSPAPHSQFMTTSAWWLEITKTMRIS
ncbi:uncharacterized protein BDW43DRAFT_286566 [Aspergillus alliaceus]|uniref:uncharacterized protein n=1 Tax=Petromyces alliaceus TaxID=209559 RepID=UPI0012A76087|nr:uncharacterized protein BDW43DRAFT_286566 [Aspergillus alliaceus]KAB8230053.1 hypothetical protein BDW43DRAFT_286566 [Aspergillus alliaceus]